MELEEVIITITIMAIIVIMVIFVIVSVFTFYDRCTSTNSKWLQRLVIHIDRFL